MSSIKTASIQQHHQLSSAGLLIALGIVFGDIGTSPLYVFKAIIGGNLIEPTLVLGSLSLIIWTITIITTFKYVLLALRADNRGEGGIFALYTQVRHFRPWLIYPAMIGGCALLADGIITPCISVSSAVEGLKVMNPEMSTVPIVLLILTVLFSVQRFGTNLVGTSFGPIITLWFSMLAVLGIWHIATAPEVLAALNPYYAFKLLFEYDNALLIVGAVFLCTTGAEALYSDLGHCGKRNIQVSWIFVKTALLLNYAGQAAWLITHSGVKLHDNPFYALMPGWFLPFGIIVATMAAIIASQALISGTFTLITEGIRLRLIPRLKVIYPTEIRGQTYVPAVNLIMLIGCYAITIYFQESSNMEAAYGVAISVTLIMTSILLTYYISKRLNHPILADAFFLSYLTIETFFLIANLHKFWHGGWVAAVVGLILFAIMWVWMRGTILKKEFLEFQDLEEHLPMLEELSKDLSVPKFSTHLVYMTEANKVNKLESKVLHSLFRRQPKRADIYWFLHVYVMDDPYSQEYKVTELIPKVAYRIDFFLGFRIEPQINSLFRQILQEMEKNGEIDLLSRYPSLRAHQIPGDFKFVVSKKYLSKEHNLKFSHSMIIKAYFMIKKILGMDEAAGFGLETSSVLTEKFPILVIPQKQKNLKRVFEKPIDL